MPLQIGESSRLMMIPNTVASRSAITPSAFHPLRDAGLVGADILDFPSGLRSVLLQNLTIAGQAAPDIEVRIRDVEEFLVAPSEYVADGYLGLDYLFGAFTSLSVDTQSLWVRLGLRPSPSTT